MAIDMFLTIPGIDGESLDATHRGAIDVFSWSWGVANIASTARPGSGTGAGAGKVSVQPLVVVKHVDLATTKLFTACCTGKHLPSAVLSVRKAGSLSFDYLTMTMESVSVTSLEIAEPDGDRLTEELTLSFGKLTIEYTPDLPDGSAGDAVAASWNLQKNSAT